MRVVGGLDVHRSQITLTRWPYWNFCTRSERSRAAVRLDSVPSVVRHHLGWANASRCGSPRGSPPGITGQDCGGLAGFGT